MRHLWLLLALVTAGPVWADESDRDIRPYDVLVMKNGGRFEGEIEAETLETITFNQSNGIRFVRQKSEIEQILRRNPPLKAYKARLKDTEKTYDDQMALGLWCADEAGLMEEAQVHLIEANRLQPKDALPYEALMALFSTTPDEEKTLSQRDREMGVYLRGRASGVPIAEVPYRAAVLLASGGEIPGSIHLLEHLLELPYANDDPDTVIAAENLLARLLEVEGRREEARQVVQRVLDERGSEAALDLLRLRSTWLLEEYASGKKEAGGPLLETVDKMLELDSSLGEAYLVRATYSMLAGDYAAASGDLTKAIENGELGFDTRISMILNYALIGKAKKAQRLLNTVPPSQENRFERGVVRSYLLQNQGEADVAHDTLKELVETGAAPWQLWILYVQTLADQEAWDDVEKQTDLFLEQFAGNSVAFSECAMFRGDLALRRGHGAEARRWLGYVAAERSGDAELWLRIGQAELLEGGDLGVARESLSKAQEAEPDDLGIRNTLGYLEYREGNLAESLRLFEGVAADYSDKERQLAEPPAPLAYAMRGIEQARGASGEEVWTDSFQREPGRVLNNWDEQETFGIQIAVDDDAVVFEGTQDFKDDGLTVLSRPVMGLSLMSRFRARIKIEPGTEVRVGLRLEDEQGEHGLVFFRRLDGVLAFSLNQGDDPEVVEPRDESEDPGSDDDAGGDAEGSDDGDESDDPSKKYDMRRVVWKDDGKSHLLEIRLDDERSPSASLYFDGERVARNVRLPLGKRSRSAVRVGVSGQAELRTKYRFRVEEFEMFRRIAKGRERERR